MHKPLLLAPPEAEVGRCKLKRCVDYRTSSRVSWAMLRNLVSNTKRVGAQFSGSTCLACTAVGSISNTALKKKLKGKGVRVELSGQILAQCTQVLSSVPSALSHTTHLVDNITETVLTTQTGNPGREKRQNRKSHVSVRVSGQRGTRRNWNEEFNIPQ